MPRLEGLRPFSAPTERWQSGRSHRTRNAAYGQPYRGFESLPLRHFQSLSGHCVCAAVCHERLEQPRLRSHDPNLALGDLDTLGKRAQVVAAVAAAVEPEDKARDLRSARCNSLASWSSRPTPSVPTNWLAR